MISACLAMEVAFSCVFQLLVAAVVDVKHSEASFVLDIDIKLVGIYKNADKIAIKLVGATVAEDAVVKNGSLLVG